MGWKYLVCSKNRFLNPDCRKLSFERDVSMLHFSSAFFFCGLDLSSSVVGLDVHQKLTLHYTALKGSGVQSHIHHAVADLHPGPKQLLSAPTSLSAVQGGNRNQGKFLMTHSCCSCYHTVVLFLVWHQIQIRNKRAAICARTSLPAATTAVSENQSRSDIWTLVPKPLLLSGKVCVTAAQRRPADRESSFSSYLSDLKSRSEALAQTPVKRLKVNRNPLFCAVHLDLLDENTLKSVV